MQRRLYPVDIAYNYFCDELENILYFRFGLKDTNGEVGVTFSLEKEMQKLDPETLKGEMVIVVEGSLGEIKPDLNNDDIIKMVKTMVEGGLSTKDAIKKVADLTNVNKNYIYKVYHLN